MKIEDLFLKSEIQSDIKVDKEMKTVFELSYFLIDFQAAINSMSEIIYDDIDGKNQIIEDEHPMWQKKIEKKRRAVSISISRGGSEWTFRFNNKIKANYESKF